MMYVVVSQDLMVLVLVRAQRFSHFSQRKLCPMGLKSWSYVRYGRERGMLRVVEVIASVKRGPVNRRASV
jgi:hypothetical protein